MFMVGIVGRRVPWISTVILMKKKEKINSTILEVLKFVQPPRAYFLCNSDSRIELDFIKQ